MRKLLLTLGLVAGTFAANAQRVSTLPIPKMPANLQYRMFTAPSNVPVSQVRVNVDTETPALETLDGKHTVTVIDTVQGWYNIGNTLNGTGAAQISGFAPYEWPDTSGYYDNNDTVNYIPWTSVGQAIDPTDPIWGQDPSGTLYTLDTTSKSYFVDSVQIPYIYTRYAETDTNGKPVVDTLVIQMIQPESIWQAVSNSGDTIHTSTIGFNTSTDLAQVSTVNGNVYSKIFTTLRIPLTANDTTNGTFGFMTKALSGVTIPAGGLKFLPHNFYPVGVIYTYKPGTHWEPGDTVGPGAKGRKHNAFRFNMQVASANPNLPTPTNGLIVQGQQRHRATWFQSSSYSSRYMSGLIFGSPLYPNASFYIRARRVTRKVVGLNEIATNIANVSLYPNPATDNLHISVELNKADNVTMRITDVLGKVVAVAANGNLPAGNNMINVSTASLQAGVYFCTINTNNGSQTQRFVVSK